MFREAIHVDYRSILVALAPLMFSKLISQVRSCLHFNRISGDQFAFYYPSFFAGRKRSVASRVPREDERSYRIKTDYALPKHIRTDL